MLEPKGAEQERRVLLVVRDAVRSERNTGRDREQDDREQARREARRPAAAEVEAEPWQHERQQAHEVALLEARRAVRGVEGGLCEENQQQPRRDSTEGRLLARARAR